MKPIKQTVYLPVEITEEFWQKWDNGEKPDYDLADIDTGENVESWVNEKEGYFFTTEQLNKYTQNVIKQALETAAENADLIETDGDVDPKSITNTFEETFKNFEV